MPVDLLSGISQGGLLLCPLCRRDWSGPAGCCATCRASLENRLELPGLSALGYYRGKLAAAVRAYKYNQVRRLAPTLGAALAELVRGRGWRPRVVTFVPLHSVRRRRRGFDQANLLATSLAADLEVPCRPLLERVRPTPQQARLSASQRRRNVRHAFRATSSVRGTILLVDDVFTTGATLKVCREVLEGAGASVVLMAVLAVAPPGGKAPSAKAPQMETNTPLVMPRRAPTRT